jgi:RimJ/RimL family protein N-acetyltransferase
VNLETERLILRQWLDDDRPAFAMLNRDPEVMQFFTFTRTPAEADAVMDLLNDHIGRHGFGFWAMESKQTGETVGFTGLQHVNFEARFCPAVEIGWRLLRPFWGEGYATEAARVSLEYAFKRLHLDEVVSFAVESNVRSRAVMERIGMVHDPEFDFDHPSIDPAHPFARHAFYRIRRADWERAAGR